MAPRIRETRRLLMEKALIAGPMGLKANEKVRLLSDYELLGELHQAVWSLPAEKLESLWGVKLEPEYREADIQPAMAVMP